ncbi:MAG: hypothetical protein K6F60_01610 [Eubacterium sp.]|nr:hypothetical protein [Eubacterium sp.]
MLLFSFDIGEMIDNWITKFLENTIWRLLYLLEVGVCKVVAWMEEIMQIFTGEVPVEYNNKSESLIMVFFTHDNVKGIYGGMALIGIAFAFAFAIVSVIRKVLDLRGKQQGVTLGAILGNLLKSILLIFSMNLIMIVALSTTNTLIKQIGAAVTNSGDVVKGRQEIKFDDEEYAAMGRILNTIGNYSLNPSYRSRYNINACYNEIRGDLEYLGNKGVFNYHYISYKNDDIEAGVVEPTWQSMVEQLARAYDYSQETTLDSYNDGLTNAMLNCMDIMKKNPDIRVLKSFKRNTESNTEQVPMDKILFVSATMGNFNGEGAARTASYNKTPSFYDSVRQPFYYGEDGSDMYDYDDVKAVFDPSPMKTNYILVYATGIAMLQEMLVIIVTCSVRIFSLLTLYLASPLVLAALPLDDGGKLKQWTTAFLVQLLGIVGMVLAMRLFLMFLPIIWSPDLKVSSYTILSIIIKCIISYGALTAVSRVNGILTGILADNAGWQAITAGDMRGSVQNSAAGRALGSLSASNIGSKIGGGIASVGKGAWNVTGGRALGAAGKAVKDATIGKAYSAITGRDLDSGEKTSATKQKDERSRQRQMKDLKANIDHVGKTGRDLNGNKVSAEQKDKMQRTYDKMNDSGMSLKDAKQSAEIDMKADKADAKQDAENEARSLKAPPPARPEQ